MDALSEIIIENRMLGMSMRNTLEMLKEIRREGRRTYWRAVRALLTDSETEIGAGWPGFWLRARTLTAMILGRRINFDEKWTYDHPRHPLHRDYVLWFDFAKVYGGWTGSYIEFHAGQFAYYVGHDGDTSL